MFLSLQSENLKKNKKNLICLFVFLKYFVSLTSNKNFRELLFIIENQRDNKN